MGLNSSIVDNDNSNKYDIEIFNLTKDYKIKGEKKFIRALNNVNLKIKKGEIFGLLGPNGAGKTTLVSIITTLLQPTSGYANILGRNILKESWFVRENVGLMLGGELNYHRLTAYRNLKFFSKLYGIKDYKEKIHKLAKIFNLTNWLNQYVSNFSKGMKLKLALARVLIIEPKILILDEPMLGLEPTSVIEVIDILKGLNKTILLASHQMDIVSKLCDRIAFLKAGKLVKIDTQENFKKLIYNKVKIELRVSKDKDKLVHSLRDFDFISEIQLINENINFFISNEIFFPELFNFLKDYSVIHFNEIKPTLDDVFIKLSK